ncbi:MAG: Calx-beta domain-containing protein [Paludibacter sp.]|nr:Calx-beta domain-containing protein [Paludibacter sp.]
MKLLKYIFLTVVSALIIASCELNKLPEFNDDDAFISFLSATSNVGEEKDSIAIPVLLTSLSGISTTVEFEFVVDAARKDSAIEGVHYTIRNTTNKLTFTKDKPTQYIIVDIIDNTSFDGDVQVNIVLKNPIGVNLGDSKLTVLKINDDEHPLLFILGDLTAKGTSYFNGAEEWAVKIEKDADDLSKVWISNLVNGGSSASSPVYGVVNDEKTEIRIPVKQAIAVSASYPRINLEGYYGPDGDDKIPTGGYLTGIIAADGTITIQDEFGSQVFSDADATVSLGWFNIYQTGVTLKK